MVSLTDIDIKILKFVKEHGPSDIKDIECSLKNIAAIQYRVKILSTPEYINSGPIRFARDNSSYLEEDYETGIDEKTKDSIFIPLGIYRITEFGKKALQDYECIKTTHHRELWLKNAWIPILVTVVTNLIIGAIKWLWPLIQELLFHTL